MKQLIENKRLLIGKRLRDLRTKIGLTHKSVAAGSGVSVGTVIAIEQGKKGHILDSILSVSYFFGFELEELCIPQFKIPNQEKLTEKLILFHKTHGSDKYSVLYAKEKTKVKNIIVERVLNNGFLDIGREIKEIIEYCKREFNLELNGPSISNVLKRLATTNKIIIVKSSKKGVFKYKRAMKK